MGCAVDRLVGIEQDVRVGADAVGAPGQLAGIEIVRGEVAADAILSARDPDDHFVMHHQRSDGHGLAQLRIAVLGAPQHLAGLGVERVDMRVQRGDQNFPVGIGDAFVHQIAAGHRGRELVLLRSEFPDDLANVVQVDGVDEVGIGALEVHHVADHQRLALLPAKRARGHGPGNFQFSGIPGIDLVQLAVADSAVASQRQHPLVGVLRIFVQFIRAANAITTRC